MPTAAPATTTNDTKLDAQVLWFNYQKEILALAVLIILGAVGFTGYRVYSAQQDSAAAALLAGAKAPADYQGVIKQYRSTPAGASAYLLLAQAQRNDRKFAESNATIQAFVQQQPKHELLSAARVTMAANFESLGRPDDALAMYQQVANNAPQSYDAVYALICQVRLLKAKNQNDIARQVCEKILLEHRDSVWAGEAMHELRALTPKEATAMPLTPPGGPAVPPLIARPAAAPAPANSPAAAAKPK